MRILCSRDRECRFLKTYVRPHLEYCIQAWNPWLIKDKEILEKVQKRAISMTSGLSGSTYEEKLRKVGLTSLEERRKNGRYDSSLENPSWT